MLFYFWILVKLTAAWWCNYITNRTLPENGPTLISHRIHLKLHHIFSRFIYDGRFILFGNRSNFRSGTEWVFRIAFQDNNRFFTATACWSIILTGEFHLYWHVVFLNNVFSFLFFTGCMGDRGNKCYMLILRDRQKTLWIISDCQPGYKYFSNISRLGYQNLLVNFWNGITQFMISLSIKNNTFKIFTLLDYIAQFSHTLAIFVSKNISTKLNERNRWHFQVCNTT